MSQQVNESASDKLHRNLAPKANRLIWESSPYLLQHAHNPVDWYPWGEEAFEKARKEGKPLLVSIGYAACHWCHVMEKESFEDPEVAAIMNEHFVNIKVDKEERPDVDHIYMDAVQAITGSGGWPLNVFITPDRKPFYGGTYFPPRRAFNRASWTEILLAISHAYQQNKSEIEQQADNLTSHLTASNAFGISSPSSNILDERKIYQAFENIMKTADKEWGGFGKAPKFPQTFTITFLIRYSHVAQSSVHGSTKSVDEALNHALLSLDKMIQGGIYDHVGGGFARYSTDNEWLVPHFEKMLYDNALLVSTLAEAYQLTGDNKYKDTLDETLQFVEREMMHQKGGFFSALDADSEGEEGKFYVWNLEEVKNILGDDAEMFCRYFDITQKGNWEEKNILRIKTPLKEFAAQNKITEDELQKVIVRGKNVLLQKRNDRIRPQIDDKVLLSWNALMNIAYSNAYAATGNAHYKDVAEKNMRFLLINLKARNNTFLHSWKNEEAKHPAFLDDYAFLISALLQLSEITGDVSWLKKAKNITETVLQQFSDTESPFFFYTSSAQKDILLRKKEIYDGATPSGNAVIAINLYRQAILFDLPEWAQMAEKMVSSLGEITIKYPTSYGVWLSLLLEMAYSTQEIAIVGANYVGLLSEVLKVYVPHRVIMAAHAPTDQFPLLKDKEVNEETLIFLCKNYACQKPVNSIKSFKSLVSSKNLKIVQ
ncbi:MAG: thioredoxin domain-containing protein [Chitinophagaceae bacterium]|nr:thioredoxin domain-containing protein [Chitinophagaceae bacterium]